MKKESIIILLLLITPVLAEQINITTIPFNSTINITINGSPNTTMYLWCDNCTYTSVTNPNLSFIDNTTTASFTINIPDNTTNQIINETYKLLDQEFNMTNSSISLILNISVPEPIPSCNINLSPNPANNTRIGSQDLLPPGIFITYQGIINWNKTSPKLLYNGQNASWILFNHTNQSFSYTFQQISDGIFTGNWTLIDQNNQTCSYNYILTINRIKPPIPLQVLPARGQYTTDTINLLVTMNAATYNISYLVKDGLPALHDAAWIQMTQTEQIYQANVEMANQPVGQLYLKIIDSYGNIRLHNTGIISSPTSSLSLFRRIRTVLPNTEADVEVTISTKTNTGVLLRCKQSDFVSNQGGNRTDSWAIRDKSFMILDDNEYIILNDYNQVINLGTGSKELTLRLDIPPTAKTGYEYESTLTCFITR